MIPLPQPQIYLRADLLFKLLSHIRLALVPLTTGGKTKTDPTLRINTKVIPALPEIRLAHYRNPVPRISTKRNPGLNRKRITQLRSLRRRTSYTRRKSIKPKRLFLKTRYKLVLTLDPVFYTTDRFGHSPVKTILKRPMRNRPFSRPNSTFHANQKYHAK